MTIRPKKANELNVLGFKIAVSQLIEKTDFESGFDLADYYLKLLMYTKTNKNNFHTLA